MAKKRLKDIDVQDLERAVQRMCIGPNGEEGLKALRKLFFDVKAYTKGDPYHTSFKEGQRDVVGFMIECQGMKEAADAVETS